MKTPKEFREFIGSNLTEVEDWMAAYAAHVAVRVAKQVRYKAIDVILDYDDDTPLGELKNNLIRDIQNISEDIAKLKNIQDEEE